MLLRTLGICLFKQLIESDLNEDIQHMNRFHFQHPGRLARARLTFNCSIGMQLPFDAPNSCAALVEMHTQCVF